MFEICSKKRGMNGLILGERQLVAFDGAGLLQAGPAGRASVAAGPCEGSQHGHRGQPALLAWLGQAWRHTSVAPFQCCFDSHRLLQNTPLKGGN